MSLDGRLIRVLDTGVIGDPTFTRDGRSVIYWRAKTMTKDGGGALYSVAADGSAPPRRLTQGVDGEDAEPDSSPVADQIVYRHANSDGSMGLRTLDLKSGLDIGITTSGLRDQDPSFSPDGSRLVFKRGTAAETDPFIADLNGTGLQNVTEHPGADSAPAWTAR